MPGRMLEGEVVRLRELRRSDLPVIVEHYNVYEKGRLRAGRRRDAWYWDGGYYDVVDIGVPREEWQKLREG